MSKPPFKRRSKSDLHTKVMEMVRVCEVPHHPHVHEACGVFVKSPDGNAIRMNWTFASMVL